jgi:hypothetical protein
MQATTEMPHEALSELMQARAEMPHGGGNDVNASASAKAEQETARGRPQSMLMQEKADMTHTATSERMQARTEMPHGGGHNDDASANAKAKQETVRG